MSVDFVVYPPARTSAHDPLFLTGDCAELGHWRADAVRLERWGDGSYHSQISLPLNHEIRWLVTRGHWRQVECEAEQHERAPRQFIVRERLKIEAHVASWGRDCIRYHRDRASIQLPHPRSICVYLPPGYATDLEQRYPVLYMHDGQNLFDASTAFGGVPWACGDIAERLIRAGRVQSLIIVGIGNTPDRIKEYGPHLVRPGEWDLARAYGRFITGELKPMIDATYRTLPDREATGIGGSSMGGLISLHLCRWYPEIFGRCLAMSPSLWWENEAFLQNLDNNSDWLKTVRLWLDMGGKEGASVTSQKMNLRRARKLARMIRKYPIQDRFHFVEDIDAGHDERAWSHRFSDALPFTFPA